MNIKGNANQLLNNIFWHLTTSSWSSTYMYMYDYVWLFCIIKGQKKEEELNFKVIYHLPWIVSITDK